MTAVDPRVIGWREACESYLEKRTGCYDYRRVRYREVGDVLAEMGLHDGHTVLDVGAGWTEFDYCLRKDYDWRGRYVPVDGGIDGVDLETWRPVGSYDFIVALELLEHIREWRSLLLGLLLRSNVGFAGTTPNPRTTDVLGMDPTHVVAIEAADLRGYGLKVREASCYGSPNDTLVFWREPHGSR